MTDFILKTQHVNSKQLCNNISSFIEVLIVDFNVIWDSDPHRIVVLGILDDHMEYMVNENKIEQWNIICDTRNNKQSDINKKITHLDVYYRQRNCYNVTVLRYTITG